MNFLRFLEGIRTPVVTEFMSLITYCGSELFFLVLAVTVFWCISKRGGYYILLVGFLGTACNQFLKIWFRIPRPWVLDPEFHVVESARAGATGYSFPSGHTQNIVGTMTCMILLERRKWIRAGAVALLILVPFSRMYLGCHTPLDVSVAFILALILAVSFRPVAGEGERAVRLLRILLAVSLLVSVFYVGFVSLYPFPADVDAENLGAAVKNAWTLLGCLLGLILVRRLDDRYLHFQVQAVWWAQVLKVALGAAVLFAIRMGLKAPLRAVLPEYPSDAVRYFLMVLFAGAVWPLSFPWFARLGRTTATGSSADK